MSKLDELYSQLNDLFTEFETNHQTNVNTGNKCWNEIRKIYW